MKTKLVIFGCGQIGQLAHFYFTEDSDYSVVAFCVDRDFISADTFCGLPVLPFEEVLQEFPPSDVHMFVALSYSKVNGVRSDKYIQCKQKGYSLATYISTHATVLNNHMIGDNCLVLEDNTIQPFVTIGNNVFIWSGNHIGHHSTIHDHSFIASHVVIGGNVTIGTRCFLGINATVRDGISIGDNCVIGAGALVLASTDSQGVYLGTTSERSAVPSNRLRGL